MKARQLEVFRAVMRCGTLSGAARALSVSQPALSQILLHTEDDLGFSLFRRVKGRLVPTAEAEELFPEADRVFEELEELRRLARELRHGKAGVVRLAASAPPALSIVPHALKSFRRTHPGVRILSYVVPSEVIVTMLDRGQAGIGIAMNDHSIPTIDTEVIGRTEIVCVMPAEHPLAARGTIAFADLEAETIISYRGDSRPGLLLARTLANAAGEFQPDIEIDVSIIALSFVKQGLGVALVDGLLPWESFPGLVVRPLHPPTSLPICLLTSTRRPLSRNHEFLRHALRRAVAEEACDPTGPSRLLPA
jgi:DNA-binding transcriptional LysR family regulator